MERRKKRPAPWHCMPVSHTRKRPCVVCCGVVMCIGEERFYDCLVDMPWMKDNHVRQKHIHIHIHMHIQSVSLYRIHASVYTYIVAVEGLGGVVEQRGVAHLGEQGGELPQPPLVLQPPISGRCWMSRVVLIGGQRDTNRDTNRLTVRVSLMLLLSRKDYSKHVLEGLGDVGVGEVDALLVQEVARLRACVSGRVCFGLHVLLCSEPHALSFHACMYTHVRTYICFSP